MLYHLSEEIGIVRFDPRPAPDLAPPVVWAIHSDRLRNYLFPRDCPRVTFFAGPDSSPADSPRLFCYRLPDATFTCVDECAGYYHSKDPVTPVHVEVIPDLLAALAAQNVEIRILPN